MIRDALVVGAGPGGAMAAHALARRGASVLLVDRERFPRWKVCGACLSAGAVASLTDAGIDGRLRAAGAVPLRRVVVARGRRRAALALGGSLALSRPALDDLVVHAAVGRGAAFRDGVTASLGPAATSYRTVRLRAGDESWEERARVVVDATGLLGLGDADSPEIRSGSRVGVGATFAADGHDVPTGELRMLVGRSGYVGLVRLEDGRVNVGAAVDPAALRGSTPGAVVAAIVSASGEPPLAGDPLLGWKGTPALTRRRPAGWGDRLFRLGDAAGYVEPFTGEGMSWALASGLAVAGPALEATRGWRPDIGADWARWQRELARSQRLCRWLARGLRRPTVVGAVLGAVAVVPALATPFLRAAAARPAAPVPAA